MNKMERAPTASTLSTQSTHTLSLCVYASFFFFASCFADPLHFVSEISQRRRESHARVSFGIQGRSNALAKTLLPKLLEGRFAIQRVGGWHIGVRVDTFKLFEAVKELLLLFRHFFWTVVVSKGLGEQRSGRGVEKSVR